MPFANGSAVGLALDGVLLLEMDPRYASRVDWGSRAGRTKATWSRQRARHRRTRHSPAPGYFRAGF